MFCPLTNSECNENCALTSSNNCGVKYLSEILGTLEDLKSANTNLYKEIADLKNIMKSTSYTFKEIVEGLQAINTTLNNQSN